jgi:hypothetical protein
MFLIAYGSVLKTPLRRVPGISRQSLPTETRSASRSVLRSVGLDLAAVAGLADNGELEGDLATLFEQAGRAAKSAGTALVLFVDEIQYIEETQFAALISALHRCRATVGRPSNSPGNRRQSRQTQQEMDERHYP